MFGLLVVEKPTVDLRNKEISVGASKEYAGQGKLDDAEQMYERALAGCTKVLGQEHPNMLPSMVILASTSIKNLTITWKGLGRDTEAIQLTEDCIQRQINILGAKYSNSLSSHLASAVLLSSNSVHLSQDT